MKVGFIGLGHMGSGMAASLIKAGHEVTVYNRTAQKVQPLVERGAHAAQGVADVCRGDAVFTMLADDGAVENTVLGKDGVLRHLARGAVHISSSTISVALSRRLAEAHVQAGQGFVAAPVFGRPEVAAAGKLSVVAAGPHEPLQRVRPLLEALGPKVSILSERPPDANLLKLSGNFLITTVIEALGEALALIERGGIDRGQYIDILTSTLFDVPIYKIYGKLLVERRFTPPGFAAPLGQKDVRLVMSAAEALDVPLPLASLIRDRFLRLMAHGGEHLDWSAIGALPAVDAALETTLLGTSAQA